MIGAAVGYGIGEGISLSVNRKCGTGLAVIGGLAVVLSYLDQRSYFLELAFQFYRYYSRDIRYFCLRSPFALK